jgi:hypothetical protein
VCTGDCSGRGACIGGSCRCVPGFAGTNCERRRCPDDCGGHGRCVQPTASVLALRPNEPPTCACLEGWKGASCSKPGCPHRCSHHGVCTEAGACACDDGWEGPSCAGVSCPAHLHNCSGRGLCEGGACLCRGPYAGVACEARGCPAGCSGHGVCADGACRCEPGWEGSDCARAVCPGAELRRDGAISGAELQSGHGQISAATSRGLACLGHGRCTGGGGDGEADGEAGGEAGGDGGGDGGAAGQMSTGGGARRKCDCFAGWGGPTCGARACAYDCGAFGTCREL